MNIRDLQASINLSAIEVKARANWEKENRKHRSLETWIVRLIPIGIVAMLGAFYLLSSAHTVALMDLLNPGFGIWAPIGMELGVVILAAFQEASKKRHTSVTFVEWTLIGISMVINIIGGFMAVTERGIAGNAVISKLTSSELVGQFGSLPAAYQAALLLVVPVGMIIPLVASVMGRYTIKLSMHSVVLEAMSDEERWQMAAPKVMFQAILEACLKQGATAKTAGSLAQTLSSEMYNFQLQIKETKPRASGVSALSASSDLPDSGQLVPQMHRPMGFISPQSGSGQHGHGQGYGRKVGASDAIRAHLQQHPEDIHAEARELAGRLGYGKTTVNDVQQEFKNA